MATPSSPQADPVAAASAAVGDSAPARADPAERAPRSDAARPDAQTEREARLAAALRENLKRRKAQARARRAPADTAGDNGGA